MALLRSSRRREVLALLSCGSSDPVIAAHSVSNRAYPIPYRRRWQITEEFFGQTGFELSFSSQNHVELYGSSTLCSLAPKPRYYEAELIGFARRLVSTTDRVFSFATAEGRLADVLRTRVAPLVLPLATRFLAVREYMFRTVSQIMLD
jgi:hypothetical protein